jgi:hypothetical protein
MGHVSVRATTRVMDQEIEAKAKALCVDAGLDPGESVVHAYGDDFTVLEWHYRWTSRPEVPGQPVISPMWRLYRAHAALELSRRRKVVEPGGTIISFRRRKG